MVSILILPASVGIATALTHYRVMDDNNAIMIPAVAAGIYAGAVAKRSIKAAAYLGMLGVAGGAGYYYYKQYKKGGQSPTNSGASH